MEIRSIEIKNIIGNSLKGNIENIRHVKTLPCLSVVQSVHGCYEISLDGGAPHVTEEGGAFVVPGGMRQNILHHNGAGSYMEAQWVFMNVIINDLFAFEDVYHIPLLISAQYQKELWELIFTIRSDSSLCKKYAAAYQLTDLLIAHSTMKKADFDNSAALLKRYVDEHYSEAISKEDLADAAFCSVPNLYRIFQKHFHLSPHNYINRVRLEHAAVLLENGSDSVTEIAEKVGFEDPAYFSKLFKETYQLSPKKYREVSIDYKFL